MANTNAELREYRVWYGLINQHGRTFEIVNATTGKAAEKIIRDKYSNSKSIRSRLIHK